MVEEDKRFFMRTVLEGNIEKEVLLKELKEVMSIESKVRIILPKKKNIISKFSL